MRAQATEAWVAATSRSFSGARARRALLIAYGVAVAVVGTFQLERAFPPEPQMMKTRVEEVGRSIEVLDAGGPPLLGRARAQSDYDWEPVPPGEPPGIYLYLPLLSQSTGETSPPILSKWLFLGAFAMLLLLLPLVFGELFRSLLAGIASPLLAFPTFNALVDTDLYWVPAWILFVALPPLFLAYRHWGRRAVLGVAALLVIASAATAIRYHAGLHVLLAALLVLVLRERRWRRRLLLGGAFCLAYLSISPLTFSAVREYRDRAVDGSIAPQPQFSSWHSMYIGLGYLANPYGIRYDDLVAYRAAQDVDPDVDYLGPGYGDALREAYLDIARDDVGFIAENVVMKVRAVMRDALEYYWSALLLVPLMLLARSRERPEARTWLLLLLPAFALTLLPPVTVIPQQQYVFGWLGAWGLLWLIAATWVVASLARLVSRLRQGSGRLPLRRESIAAVATSRGVFASASGVLVLVALAAIPESDAVARQRVLENFRTPSQLVADPLPAAATTHEWSFAGGLPDGWTSGDGVRVRPSRTGLEVRTTDEGFRTEILGPELRLEPGAYRVAMAAEPESGGLVLGALDTVARRWFLTATFHAERSGFDRSWMVLPFVLDKPLTMRIAVANLPFEPASSRWRIRSVVVQRTG